MINEISNLFSFLVFLASLSPLHSSHFIPTHYVHNLNHTNGLYFEKTQNFFLTDSTWKLITYFDLGHFLSQKPGSPTLTFNHLDICNKSKHCPEKIQAQWCINRYMHMDRIHTQFLQMLSANESSSTFDPLPKTMVKRGAPFAFVGKVSNILFGTLDEDGSEHLESEISILNESNQALADLAANQTHIVKSKLQQMYGHLKTMEVESQHLEDSVRQIQNTETELFRKQSLNQLFSNIEEKINQYETHLHTLILSITLAREGILHPEFISPGQIQSSINAIKKSHPHLRFPIDNTMTESLKGICTTKILAGKNRLTIEIEIPLLRPKSFELFKIHPLPVHQNLNSSKGNFAFIAPKDDYLALSVDYEKYFTISNYHLQNCKETISKTICNFPKVLKEVSTNPSCESRMLLEPSPRALELCNLKLIKRVNPYWVKLESVNSWLFSTSQTEMLKTVCEDDSIESISIHNSGILQLRPGCEARSSSVTLPAHTSYKAATHIIYEHNFTLDLANVISEQELLAELPSLIPISPKTEQKDDWDLQNESVDLDEIEQKYKNIKAHLQTSNLAKTSSVGTLGSGIIILIIIIGYIAWKVLPKRKSVKRKSSKQSSQAVVINMNSLKESPTPERHHDNLASNDTQDCHDCPSPKIPTAPPLPSSLPPVDRPSIFFSTSRKSLADIY